MLFLRPLLFWNCNSNELTVKLNTEQFTKWRRRTGLIWLMLECFIARKQNISKWSRNRWRSRLTFLQSVTLHSVSSLWLSELGDYLSSENDIMFNNNEIFLLSLLDFLDFPIFWQKIKSSWICAHTVFLQIKVKMRKDDNSPNFETDNLNSFNSKSPIPSFIANSETPRKVEAFLHYNNVVLCFVKKYSTPMPFKGTVVFTSMNAN